MYSVYDKNDEKIFGCSSLHAVIKYIAEVGVINVVTGTKVCINLVNGEHIILEFGCSTSAHDWIVEHVPGEFVKILSRDGGCEYLYEKEYL